MPRFDMPDRPGTTVTLFPSGRRRDFPLPYDTEDPAEVKVLRRYPGLKETRKASSKASPPAPKPPEEVKP